MEILLQLLDNKRYAFQFRLSSRFPKFCLISLACKTGVIFLCVFQASAKHEASAECESRAKGLAKRMLASCFVLGFVLAWKTPKTEACSRLCSAGYIS